MTETTPASAMDRLRQQVEALLDGVEPAVAIPELRKVLECLGSGLSAPDALAVAALAHAGLSETLRAVGQLHDAMVHALDADQLAERSADVPAHARALLAVAHVCFQIGQHDEARRRLDTVVELDGVSAELRVRARMNLAALLRADGQVELAGGAFDAMLGDLDQVSSELNASVLINAASCYHQLDRVADAESALDRARGLLDPAVRPDLWAWMDAIGAWVASRARRVEPALRMARAALSPRRAGADLDIRSSAARALAEVGLWRDDPELRAEAVLALEAVAAQAETERARKPAVDLHGSLAQIHEAEGDLVRAVRHLRAARKLENELRDQGERLRRERESLRLELVRMQVEADALRAHQEELSRANAALLASDAARARLLRTLAHDLRTPLTSLLVTVDLVDPASPDDVRQSMETVAKAVDRMVAILDEALAPPEQRDQEEVDLVEVVRQGAASFGALAGRKGQSVRVLAQGPVLLHASRAALGRLVDNLLSNALKYGPAGGTVDITVSSEGRRADLVVMDQGPGFPGVDPSEGLLFGHQLASRATGGEASWGMGLHSVYQLLAELGGILSIGNREQGGATVRVTLPLS